MRSMRSQSVVLAVAEAAGDAAVELDQAVDALGATIAGAAGVEVGQEGVLPLLEGATKSGDLRDRARGKAGDDLLGDLAALGRVGVGVGGPHLLGALPGDVDGIMAFISSDRRGEAGVLFIVEVLDPYLSTPPSPSVSPTHRKYEEPV